MPRHGPPVTERGRLALLGVAGLVSAGGLTVEVGPLGALVALLAVGVAALVGGVYGVGVLHLGILGVGVTPSVVGVILVEAAAVFLFVSDGSPGHRLELGALAVVLTSTLAVGVTTLAEARGLLVGAVVLCLVVAVGSYLVHRYGRVRLGLAAGELDT